MIKIDPTVLIVMGEVILALLVLVVAALVYFIKSKKRDKQAVEVLQGRLEDNVEKRQEMFEKLIGQASGNGEDEDGTNREMAREWVDNENKFYNRLVEMYMQRNSSALKSLDKLLHEYTSSYLDLVALMRERVETQEADLSEEMKQQLERLEQDGHKLASEVDKLKQENQRLSKELEQAYSEIDQAMREYSQAFRPGGMTGSAATQAAAAQTASKAEAEPSSPAAENEAGEHVAAGDRHEAEVEMTVEVAVQPEVVTTSEIDESRPAALEEEPAPEPELEPEPDLEESAPGPKNDADLLREMGVNEEQSLEDVVLHAMAEESAAQRQQQETVTDEDDEEQDSPEAAGDKEPRGPVVELSKEEDIVLSEPEEPLSDEELLGEAVLDEMSREKVAQPQAADETDGIDEDELLAQLAGLEDDDDASGLEGFGEASEGDEEGRKKEP